MHAIVFADRTGYELSPLNEVYVPALLPIGGKPVLEHTIEQLKQCHVTHIFLVVGLQSEAIRAHFGSGERWSLHITYLHRARGESPARLLHKLGARLPASFYALRGDVLHPREPETFNAAYLCTAAATGALNRLAWPGENAVPGKKCNRLASIRDYYERALQANREDSATRGLAADERLRLGIQASARAVSVDSGRLSVGHFSRVAESAKCHGDVVIGQYCVIDSGVVMEDTIVMDNTYVGEGLALNQAIVMNDRIIRVDLDITIPISDAFLISAVNADAHCEQTPWVERLSALLLTLCLLPIGCLQLFLVCLKQRRGSLGIRELHGNRGPFRTLGVADCDGPLNWLARLFGVLQGHLRLFGRPAQQAANDTAVSTETPWQPVYQALPIGAFSVADVLASHTEPALQELLAIELQRASRSHRWHTLWCHLKRRYAPFFWSQSNRPTTSEPLNHNLGNRP